jgi:hypothetical protein
MLWTIFAILFSIWVLGFVTGFIHILLITAAALLVINLIQVRRLW